MTAMLSQPSPVLLPSWRKLRGMRYSPYTICLLPGCDLLQADAIIFNYLLADLQWLGFGPQRHHGDDVCCPACCNCSQQPVKQCGSNPLCTVNVYLKTTWIASYLMNLFPLSLHAGCWLYALETWWSQLITERMGTYNFCVPEYNFLIQLVPLEQIKKKHLSQRWWQKSFYL